VANRSNPATPEVLPIQPKLENSPPSTIRTSYDQSGLHRQTVLMWGSGNQSSNEMSSPASNTRSPCDTPKHFNHHHHHNSPVPTTTLNQQSTVEKCGKNIESIQNHVKWNGNSAINNGKEVISIFPIHHNSEAYTPPASTNPLSHSIDTHHHSNHHLHRSDITNCEVWPYSQYQYFSYHHAHHQHQASTQ
jgi:hypothetical protein